MGVNPGACSKALKGCGKGCGKSSDDIARHTDDPGRSSSHIPPSSDDVAKNADEPHLQTNPSSNPTFANESPEVVENVIVVQKNENGFYHYSGHTYSRFDEIPFHSMDQVYLEGELTADKAAYLMSKGVKFCFNNSMHQVQREKSFKIIFLISEDVETVKMLYNLDDENARKLIRYTSSVIENPSIIKSESFEAMLLRQQEVLSDGEVPVLVFHNNISPEMIVGLDPSTNIITCNSFRVSPRAYLSSTDLIDINGVVKGLEAGSERGNLKAFYNEFTNAYYEHMRLQRQKTTLIYIGGGIGVGGGVYAVAYYNQDNS